MKPFPMEYLVTVTCSASGSQQVSLTFQADAKFELHSITGISSKDTATNFVNNNFSCQITNQSTGKSWSNARIPQSLLCGNALSESLLQKRQIVIDEKSTFLFDILDLAASGNNTVTMVFRGYGIPLEQNG